MIFGLKYQNSVSLRISGSVHYDFDFGYTSVKWYLQQMFFHIFKILIFGVLGWGKRAQNGFSPSWCISQELCIVSSRFLVYRCKKMMSPGVYLFIVKCNIVNIKIFFFIDPLQQFFVINICFSSLSVNAKNKFWGVSHLLVCHFSCKGQKNRYKIKWWL